VIPMGMRHRPVAQRETGVLVVEEVGTVNTGDKEGDHRGMTPYTDEGLRRGARVNIDHARVRRVCQGVFGKMDVHLRTLGRYLLFARADSHFPEIRRDHPYLPKNSLPTQRPPQRDTTQSYTDAPPRLPATCERCPRSAEDFNALTKSQNPPLRYSGSASELCLPAGDDGFLSFRFQNRPLFLLLPCFLVKRDRTQTLLGWIIRKVTHIVRFVIHLQ